MTRGGPARAAARERDDVRVTPEKVVAALLVRRAAQLLRDLRRRADRRDRAARRRHAALASHCSPEAPRWRCPRALACRRGGGGWAGLGSVRATSEFDHQQGAGIADLHRLGAPLSPIGAGRPRVDELLRADQGPVDARSAGEPCAVVVV